MQVIKNKQLDEAVNTFQNTSFSPAVDSSLIPTDESWLLCTLTSNPILCFCHASLRVLRASQSSMCARENSLQDARVREVEKRKSGGRGALMQKSDCS